MYICIHMHRSLNRLKGIEEWWNISCFFKSSHFPSLSLICNIVKMRKLLSAQNSDCVLIICEREQDYCTCKCRYVTTWPPGFIIPRARDRRTHKHAHTHTCFCACMHACVYMCVCVCERATHTNTHINAYISTYMYTNNNIMTHICTHTYTGGAGQYTCLK